MVPRRSQTTVETIRFVDGDDLDLIRDIEQSFGVAFGDEPANWSTVGDVYNALVERIPPVEEAGKCATSMAFYRTRTALQRITGTTDLLKPSTRLADFVSISQRRLFQQLSAELGVRKPRLAMSWWGLIGAFGCLFGVFGVFSSIAAHWIFPVVILLPMGALMIAYDMGSFRSTTVGDLARIVARMNFQHFAQSGADRRPQTIWDTLCALISDVSGIEPIRITAETRVLAQ
jgi:hypothetical protein